MFGFLVISEPNLSELLTFPLSILFGILEEKSWINHCLEFTIMMYACFSHFCYFLFLIILPNLFYYLFQHLHTKDLVNSIALQLQSHNTFHFLLSCGQFTFLRMTLRICSFLQIPGNTGTTARTCAAAAVGLHLIEVGVASCRMSYNAIFSLYVMSF